MVEYNSRLGRFLRFFSSHPQIGEISKKWTGLGEEMFTDADNFGVSFPVDLDIKVILTWIYQNHIMRMVLDFMILDPNS